MIVLAFLWVFLKPAPTPVEDSPFGPRTAFDPKLFPAYEPPAATSEAREEAAPAEAAGKPANPAAAQPLAPPSRIAPLPATETVRYRRPATAPNGQPWPTEPTYVRGYQMLRADGLSSATIDNSRNGADIFAKLVYLDGGHSIPARVFYIPGFKTITLTNINPGRYDLRYRDLNSGELTRTTPFILKESPKIGSVSAAMCDGRPAGTLMASNSFMTIISA